MAHRSALSRVALGLLALFWLLPGIPRAAAAADMRPIGEALVSVGMPSDFAGLAQEQHIVADVFFGNRQIGQFEIVAAPGRVHIVHPERLIGAIPGLSDPAAILGALSQSDLDTNARLLCTAAFEFCPHPQPDVAAVTFDQRRFRLDIFVNPRYLLIRPVSTDRYLSPSGHGLALVDTIGAAIAGGDGQSTAYDLHNRAILSAGNARLVSEASYSSGSDVSVDTLAAEIDRPNLRYSGGLFYAPGMDLVGRRRIVGIGVASQFDTRMDRDLLTGSPLVVFLQQRSRVDLFASGRLMSSNSYEAGNQTLDTSSLPQGSYAVDIRIQEAGGTIRTERRFFTKSAAIPPAGRTVFFADAGLLAVDRERSLVSVAHTPIGVLGAARRIGSHFAYDATITATDRKALVEIGGNYFSPVIHARVAVLGSTLGDYGILAQASSATASAFNYNFDARHVESHDNGPLLPLDDFGSDSFSVTTAQLQNAQLGTGSFSQLTANLSYRVARAQIGLSGYFRHDAGQGSNYAVGPTVHWPIIQRQRMQLNFDGSFAETDRGRSIAFGLRLQVFGPHSSLTASTGAQTSSAEDGRNHIGAIADLTGTIQRDHVLGGDFSGSAGIQHGSDGTLLQGAIDERGPAGYIAGNLIHRADGAYSSTQYGMSFQTSVAASARGFSIGARQQNDSMITVSLGGTAKTVAFEVLIDDSPQGRIRPGSKLTVAVTPYRRYTVRVRPIGGDLVVFDAQPKIVDVYPGTVAALNWTADPVLAMFGRLVRPDGSAVTDAEINTPGAIGESDERGFFQIQASGHAVLSVRTGNGQTCHAVLAAQRSDKGYTALGDIMCKP